MYKPDGDIVTLVAMSSDNGMRTTSTGELSRRLIPIVSTSRRRLKPEGPCQGTYTWPIAVTTRGREPSWFSVGDEGSPTSPQDSGKGHR